MQFKELNILWYRFIWRFLTIIILAHYTTGILVNYLAKNYLAGSNYLVPTMLLYHLALNLISFCLILTWLQNKKFKNSDFIFRTKAKTKIGKFGISVSLFLNYLILLFVIRVFVKYLLAKILISFNLPDEIITKISSFASLFAIVIASYILFFIIVLRNKKSKCKD